ncbi:hypothetical protein EJ02DRAFT_427065 [Clathrospora elynae]|uniref:LysM domain-containing protein n=1 Tax=Clathrospora elynae TaxID=706981 RepID=A0A6A5S8L9_9PLEO|nr:hypothetical protein EJ02DRAFT_427065 [Clathrospora elynae]
MPKQPGMVANCNKFHWIANGVVCSQVISYQKITLADFVAWNPTIKDDCTGMWAEVNVCVGVIGGATTTTPKPSSTTPGNGFHWVAKGVVCSQVTSYQKISLADFVRWNPTVKDDCTGMWVDVNVCVGVIAGASSTSAGNGVQTPQPTQSGMNSGVGSDCKGMWAKSYVCDGV